VGYDLWLRSHGDDEDDGDDSLMAGGFTKLRLSVVGTELAANVVGHERFPDTVYEGARRQIEARYPNLIEIDID
jgi:hypothetical protein